MKRLLFTIAFIAFACVGFGQYTIKGPYDATGYACIPTLTGYFEFVAGGAEN